MSEIAKLYENVGINPTHYDACALEDKYWNNEELTNQYGTFDGYLSFECPYHGEGCYSTCEYAYDKDVYPQFTTEKQLSIVKFLLGKSVYYDTDGDREYWFHISNEIENSKYREFDEAIAECINKMWEDLRDYEKVQIKEILE